MGKLFVFGDSYAATTKQSLGLTDPGNYSRIFDVFYTIFGVDDPNRLDNSWVDLLSDALKMELSHHAYPGAGNDFIYKMFMENYVPSREEDDVVVIVWTQIARFHTLYKQKYQHVMDLTDEVLEQLEPLRGNVIEKLGDDNTAFGCKDKSNNFVRDYYEVFDKDMQFCKILAYVNSVNQIASSSTIVHLFAFEPEYNYMSKYIEQDYHTYLYRFAITNRSLKERKKLYDKYKATSTEFAKTLGSGYADPLANHMSAIDNTILSDDIEQIITKKRLKESKPKDPFIYW